MRDENKEEERSREMVSGETGRLCRPNIGCDFSIEKTTDAAACCQWEELRKHQSRECEEICMDSIYKYR